MQITQPDSHLPAALQSFSLPVETTGIQTETLQAGGICPICDVGRLDYDGLLNLTCSSCGFNIGGGGGCT